MGKGKRILVADDDRDILDLLEYNLEKEGFKVRCTDRSEQVLELLADFHPDLIILDIMMPNLNGIELCKRIREQDAYQNTYIFFLSARSELYFQEAAFETGADDYIEKIIGLRALTHKVVSVLSRNYIIRKRQEEVAVGSMRVNRRKNKVVVDHREISLSKPEMELLFFFAQNPGKTISTELLLNNIWGSEVFSAAPSLEGFLRNLTDKIGRPWISQVSENKYQLRSLR